MAEAEREQTSNRVKMQNSATHIGRAENQSGLNPQN